MKLELGTPVYHLIRKWPAFKRMLFPEGNEMKDMKAQLEKLLTEASECSLIAKLASDKAKRELFAKLAEHYTVLAAEVRKAIESAARE